MENSKFPNLLQVFIEYNTNHQIQYLFLDYLYRNGK